MDNSNKQSVIELKAYLKDRGGCDNSDYIKAGLVGLCTTANVEFVHQWFRW